MRGAVSCRPCLGKYTWISRSLSSHVAFLRTPLGSRTTINRSWRNNKHTKCKMTIMWIGCFLQIEAFPEMSFIVTSSHSKNMETQELFSQTTLWLTVFIPYVGCCRWCPWRRIWLYPCHRGTYHPTTRQQWASSLAKREASSTTFLPVLWQILSPGLTQNDDYYSIERM